MATKLTKAITREAVVKSHWAARGRYIVTLIPSPTGDLIQFREKKKKKSYTATLESVLRLAIQQEMAFDYRQAMSEYQTKKKAGYKRLRKPKKPTLF